MHNKRIRQSTQHDISQLATDKNGKKPYPKGVTKFWKEGGTRTDWGEKLWSFAMGAVCNNIFASPLSPTKTEVFPYT